jgi:preprotein translocase subunit SecY
MANNGLQKDGMFYKKMQAGAPASEILAVSSFGLEVVDLKVYDDFSVAASTPAVSVNLFQIPIGQSSKTLADTSLVQAGQLEGGQAFRVRAIELKVLPTVAFVDAVAFAQNCTLNFTISSGRTYGQYPLAFLPGGSVPIVNAAATTVAATTIESVSQGFPSVGNVLPLQYPVTIGDGEHFSWKLDVQVPFSTSSTGTGYKAWLVMHGDLFRFIR